MAENVGLGAPAGLLNVVQVYVRFASPPSSAPSTLSCDLIPAEGLGEAAAGVATVGAALITVPLAAPLTELLVART